MKKLPHLKGAMQLQGQQNMCFHRSAAFVLDVPTARLCMGTFPAATPEELELEPEASREPFIHCWAEVGDSVYAPTTIEKVGGLRPIPRAYYYEINRAQDIKWIDRPTLLRISKEIGLSAHLRHGKPARRSVGGTLLDAAGIEYQISRNGGVVPA